jgi:ribosomal protein L36
MLPCLQLGSSLEAAEAPAASDSSNLHAKCIIVRDTGVRRLICVPARAA